MFKTERLSFLVFCDRLYFFPKLEDYKPQDFPKLVFFS